MSQAAARASTRSAEHWLLLVGSFATLVLFVALGALVEPDARGYGTHTALGLPDCKTIAWWGVPCPGCGVTTSLCLAAHGRLWAALWNQPFGFACAGVLVFAPLGASWAHLRGADLFELASRARARAWIGGGLALMLVAWVWKIGLVRGWWG